MTAPGTADWRAILKRRTLVAEPSGIGTAVEECLRWVTPIQAFGRTVVRDTELGGRKLRAGDWLVLPNTFPIPVGRLGSGLRVTTISTSAGTTASMARR